ncbi:conserved hypothetical protein [Culex quinquefasciatus]|uniref:Uncharacterized protein n=1 Tax=Culex quinquefasciatus TaxID=7176 RepID=B0WMJ2_CULQU|nr:conserved hypothetical protein [Culex quinquefasciatus]|eukprot:XP_001849926.1 conserved hypothetical protein [Culex quinquefasciatus]
MALCDMFTLLFPAPGLLYMYTFGNHYKPLSPIAACYVWNALNELNYINRRGCFGGRMCNRLINSPSAIVLRFEDLSRGSKALPSPQQK